MSTLKVDTIQDTNSVEMYLCKAWVNFNGTGTVAIRESGNVSSITDNGTGSYTVNFTTAMPDANYAPNVTCNWDNGSAGSNVTVTAAPTTSSFYFRVGYGYFTLADMVGLYVAIFR